MSDELPRALIEPEAPACRNYKIGDPYRPIGTTVTLGDQPVWKWEYDKYAGELTPVWPSQRHRVQLGPDEVERTVRIVYDPEHHAIITRTVADRFGQKASS